MIYFLVGCMIGVIALSRFATDYGYRGISKSRSIRNATESAIGGVIVVIIVIVVEMLFA